MKRDLSGFVRITKRTNPEDFVQALEKAIDEIKSRNNIVVTIAAYKNGDELLICLDCMASFFCDISLVFDSPDVSGIQEWPGNVPFICERCHCLSRGLDD